jgi:hypothetical protein
MGRTRGGPYRVDVSQTAVLNRISMRRYARTSRTVMAGVIALIAGSILGILAVR